MWTTESLSAFEFFTKNEQKIHFEFIFDYQNDPDSLWVVHQLKAFVDNEIAGNIKVSYIPEEKWNNEMESNNYPAIINYLDKVKGFCLGIKHNTPEKDVFMKLCLHVDYARHRFFYADSFDKKEYDANKKIVVDKIVKKFEESYQSTKNFHVDCPLVDYINTEEPWKRQGIGHAMYFMMASIVNENGFQMRSSGVKTDDGKKHFNAFARNYPEIVIERDGYFFIDFNAEENLLMAL